MSSEIVKKKRKKFVKPTMRTVNRWFHDAPKNWEYQEFFCDFLMATNPNRTRCRHYTSSMFKRDMHRLFDYLPASEVERMYQAMCWLIREGLSRWGRVYFKELFHITTWDVPLNSAYENLNLKVVGRRKEFVRRIQMIPTNIVKSVMTPNSTKWFLGTAKASGKLTLTKAMSYNEIHSQLGKGLIQTVFDSDFAYLGYNEEYQELIEKKIISAFGNEYLDGVDDYDYDNSNRKQETIAAVDFPTRDQD